MVNIFQIIFAAVLSYFIFKILRQLKTQSSNKLFIYIWLLFGIFGLIVILVPPVSTAISTFMGIGRGADLVIYTAIILLYIFLYNLYIKYLNLEEKVKKMSTKYALAEFLTPDDFSKTSKKRKRHKD